MRVIQASFGSGCQDARPRTRRVFIDVEQRGRGHGDELAISHSVALLKEEGKSYIRERRSKGKCKGSFTRFSILKGCCSALSSMGSGGAVRGAFARALSLNKGCDVVGLVYLFFFFFSPYGT